MEARHETTIKVWRPGLRDSGERLRQDMEDKILFIGIATGTFVLSIIIITLCYVKRWCCFLVKNLKKEDFPILDFK